MIKFNKPEQLNGEQLIAELKAIGVIVNDKTSPLIDGNGDFWLDIDSKDEIKTKQIVEVHVGIDTKLDKISAKETVLNKLGITADEAKLLLG
jgi:hypothetical protein